MIGTSATGNPYSQLGQESHLVAVKNICSQIIQYLYVVDHKMLDQAVGKLDSLNRKTPLRKAIIEYESQQRLGKSILDLGKQQ